MTQATASWNPDRDWLVREINDLTYILSGDLSEMRPAVFARFSEQLRDRRRELAKVERRAE